MSGRSAQTAWVTQVLLFIAFLGFMARLGLWHVSVGSNDVLLWHDVGKAIVENGLLWTYQNLPDCNQPPGQPLIAAGAYAIAAATGASFAKWFKLPMLLADAATAWMIWRIVRPRRGIAAAAGAVALFSWSIVSILVSAHHGNGDPLCAALALAAVMLLQDGRRPFLGGLLLGAAINVKLIPLVLIPPMIAACENRRCVGRLLDGLAIMAIPSLLMILLIPEAFTARVLMYLPPRSHWGIGYFLIELRQVAAMTEAADRMLIWYYVKGAYVLLAAVVAMSVFQRVTRRWDRYQLAAITMALLLILAPGFGLQYTVYAVALLIIVWPAGGFAYATLAGAYAGLSYWLRWDGQTPILTWFTVEFDFLPGRLFGALAWGTLVLCAIRTLQQRAADERLLGQAIDSGLRSPGR